MIVDRSLQRADRLNISCDSDMSPASPTLTADTPPISLSLSTSLAMEQPPRSSRATVTVPFDARGASTLGSMTVAVA
jgi:hypothetical protein